MNVRKISQKQEKSVAKDLSARTVVASGALWNAKADVRNSQFLVECKTTSKDYYTITAKVWEKICKEANRDRMREPLLVIDLHNNHKERYVCFPFTIIPFTLGGENDVTPLWLKGNIVSVSANAKQFRFFGVAKHHATTVTFYSSNKKRYNTIVLMRFKDFERFCNEVLYKEDK